MAVQSALDFLAKKRPPDIPGVVVVYGKEPFLRQLVIAAVRQHVLGDGDAELSLTRFEGKSVQPRDVFDELGTLSMFSTGRRLVLVEAADEFVTQHRPLLEDYAARPKPSGVLLLDAPQWKTTTRLHKSIVASGLPIECKPPSAAKLEAWVVAWAASAHDIKLDHDAAEMLTEIVGPQMGLLDQELAKVASFAGSEKKIDVAALSEVVGKTRAKTVWNMLNHAAEGDASAALVEMDRLIAEGEDATALIGRIGSSLRRFAAATRLIEAEEAAGRRPSIRRTLEQTGVKSFVLASTEAQLRQLGRARAGAMYRWILEAELAVRGNSTLDARIVLEQFVVRMSREYQAEQRVTAHR